MLRKRQTVAQAHDGICWCTEWSPSGAFLASSGQDKRIHIWKVTPEGLSRVAIGNRDDSVHTRTIRRVSWRADSSFLAASSFDSTASMWRVTDTGDISHLVTLSGQESEVKGVCFSPCGSYLATCSRDKSVWIFDIQEVVAGSDRRSDTSEAYQQISMDDSVSQHSEEAEFQFASSPRVRSPSYQQVECLAVLQGHSQDVKCVKFDPSDPTFLVSVSYDNSIKIWGCSAPEADDWELMETLRGHTGTVWDIAFNPSTTHEFATVSADGTLRIWSPKPVSPRQYNLSKWYQNEGPLMLPGKLAQRRRAVPVPDTETWSSQTIHVTVPSEVDVLPAPLYSVAWQGQSIAVACGDNAVRVLERTDAGDVIPVSTYKTSAEPNCVSWKKLEEGSYPLLAIALDDGSIDICELVE